MFLQPADFETVIREDIRSLITGYDDQLLQDAAAAAIAEMEGYLRPRYKLTDLFLQYETWQAGTYPAGSLVIKDGIYYRALQNTATEPPSNKWQPGDDRNPYLVITTVNIALLHLHRRINPRKVPEHVNLAYDRAIEWLREVRKGTVDLPTQNYDTTNGDQNQNNLQDAGEQTLWGGRDKKRNNYF